MKRTVVVGACFWCGRDPAAGSASATGKGEINEEEVWVELRFCHADGPRPTCYEQFNRLLRYDDMTRHFSLRAQTAPAPADPSTGAAADLQGAEDRPRA